MHTSLHGICCGYQIAKVVPALLPACWPFCTVWLWDLWAEVLRHERQHVAAVSGVQVCVHHAALIAVFDNLVSMIAMARALPDSHEIHSRPA